MIRVRSQLGRARLCSRPTIEVVNSLRCREQAPAIVGCPNSQSTTRCRHVLPHATRYSALRNETGMRRRQPAATPGSIAFCAIQGVVCLRCRRQAAVIARSSNYQPRACYRCVSTYATKSPVLRNETTMRRHGLPTASPPAHSRVLLRERPQGGTPSACWTVLPPRTVAITATAAWRAEARPCQAVQPGSGGRTTRATK